MRCVGEVSAAKVLLWHLNSEALDVEHIDLVLEANYRQQIGTTTFVVRS